MRKYVEALGGRLELRAVFPDGEFILDALSTPELPRSLKKSR